MVTANGGAGRHDQKIVRIDFNDPRGLFKKKAHLYSFLPWRVLEDCCVAHDGLYSSLIFFITFMLTVTSIPLAPVLEYATLTADTAQWGSLGVFAMTVSQLMFHGAGRDGTVEHCKILALQALLYTVQFLLEENTNNAESTVTLSP